MLVFQVIMYHTTTNTTTSTSTNNSTVPNQTNISINKTVNTYFVNVRSDMSGTSSVLGVLKKGDVVTVTEVKNGWNKITYNGKTGYIDHRYLTEGGSTTTNTTTSTTTTTTYATVNTALNLRSSASNSASIIGYLKQGEQITILEQNSSGWYKVLVDGKTVGYVYGKYVTVISSGSNTTNTGTTTGTSTTNTNTNATNTSTTNTNTNTTTNTTDTIKITDAANNITTDYSTSPPISTNGTDTFYRVVDLKVGDVINGLRITYLDLHDNNEFLEGTSSNNFQLVFSIRFEPVSDYTLEVLPGTLTAGMDDSINYQNVNSEIEPFKLEGNSGRVYYAEPGDRYGLYEKYGTNVTSSTLSLYGVSQFEQVDDGYNYMEIRDSLFDLIYGEDAEIIYYDFNLTTGYGGDIDLDASKTRLSSYDDPIKIKINELSMSTAWGAWGRLHIMSAEIID